MSSKLPFGHPQYFFMQHAKNLDAAFVESLVRATMPENHPSFPERIFEIGSPEWEARVQNWIRVARETQFGGGWDFDYPMVKSPGASLQTYSVNLSLTMPRFEVRPKQMVTLDQMIADRKHWMMLTGNSNLLWTKAEHMEWFLDKCRKFLPVVEPEFAFADLDTPVVRNLATANDPPPREHTTPFRSTERVLLGDPRAFAWPLMIFGPKEVGRIGREKLEKAPVWKVEHLDYGGIWLQVSENPFDAERSEIVELGKHLGLAPRK